MIKCMSCGTEVPPSWVAAIKSGFCPACGGNLLDESAKQLIDELTVALEQMPNNPAGIAGWLLSNYHIAKISDDPAQPVEFYGQRRPPQMSNVIHQNDFIRRAGIDVSKNIENQARLQNIVKELNSAQDNMYGGREEDEISGDFEPTSEDIAIAQAAVPFGGSKLNTSPGAVTNQDLIEIKKQAGVVAEKAGAIPNALEMDRLRRLQRQEQNLANFSGGKTKPIKRLSED